jgi:hypothetical protein
MPTGDKTGAGAGVNTPPPVMFSTVTAPVTSSVS